MKIIIIAALLSIVYTQNCSIIYDSQFQVFATINETKVWDMRKNFFNGENLRYEISGGCPYFETQDPIQQISNSFHAKQVTGKILKFKVRRIPENVVWINDFIFLEQNQTDYNIYYSNGQQQDSAPFFSKSIRVASTSSDFECYDLDFFSQSNAIVDCQRTMDDGEIVNGFIVMDLINSQYYDIFLNVHPDGYKYNYTTSRKILFHNYTFANVGDEQEEGGLQGDTLQLLFRGEPAWATEHADLSQDKLDDDCELEVYKFVNNKLANQGKPVAVLTKTVLADLLKQDPTKQKFYLMDFQIEPNGDIYILDAYQGVFVLYFSGQDLTWKLKSRFLPINQSICYGFDFNYLTNSDGQIKHLVLLFKDTASFYENNYAKFTIKLPELANYGTLSASLSQEYFIFQSRSTQKVYLYNSKDGQQLYVFNATELHKILVNPYTPEMIGVNAQSAYKFSLTQGLLKLIKQEKVNGGLKTCVIRALTSNFICQLAVNIQILTNNDTSIYQQDQRALPFIMTAQQDMIGLGFAASGPNLHYDIFSNNFNQNLNLIFPTTKQAWNLNLNGIQLVQPWDVYYADIQVFDDNREFFILLQTSRKIVYIYKCFHEIEDNENAKCSEFVLFSLKIQISSSKKNFYWHIQCSVLVFISQETDFSIQFYTGINGTITQVGQLLLDGSSTENKITDVTFQGNYIFLVQGLKQTIQVWSTSIPYQFIYEINDQVQTVFNIQEKFQPIRVYQNNQANNNLILIQTNLSLQVAMFESSKLFTKYVILKNLPLLQNADINVAIGEQSFFVIQKLENIDLIEEYSFEQLDNIKKIKELPLYHYQLQKPLTVDASSQKGWLFVRAQYNQQTVILVYKPNELAHNSLYKVIETNTFNFNLKTFDLTVDGEEQIFIYYNNQTTQTIIALLEESQALFSSNSNQFYVNQLIATLNISNFQSNTPLQTNYQLTILDTMVSLEINQSLFDKKEKVFPFIKQNETQFIDMGSDWYSGQVLNFQVVCDSCGENLQVRQKMSLRGVGQDMIYEISDGVQYGKNGQVYQTRNSIVFQTIQGQFQSVRRIPTTTQDCELITVSKSQEFIISTWNDYRKSEVGVFINQCTTENTCLQFKQGFETINGISSIEKIKMVDNKNILVLSQDIDLQNDGILLVTQFSYTSQSYSVSNTYTINDAYVGSKFLQIGDFDYISYTINGNVYSTIIFTDLNNGLYFSHFSINSQGILAKTVSEQIRLRQLEKDQYFLYEDTKFYQVRVINQVLIGTVLQLNVLVTTSNTANYIFGFDLDASKPNFGIPIIKSKTQLLYTLVPYGNWESINKISVFDQYVAIPYSDSTKVMIAIYEIPNARPGETKVITFTQGIDADYYKILPQDFALVFNKVEEAAYPYLYTNINYYFKYDEYLFETYQLNSGPQLVLSNSKNLPDEVQINIKLSNEFYKTEGQAFLKAYKTIPNENVEVADVKLENLRGKSIKISI